MSGNEHQHCASCDCHGHRTLRQAQTGSGVWSTLLPVLACALCPACLTTYAKVLSVAGIGLGLSELEHLVLLGIALVSSLTISAWRSWRTRSAWPIALATIGSALVAAGHFGGDLPALEWSGVLVLLGGGLSEHFRLRRRPVLKKMQMA